MEQPTSKAHQAAQYEHVLQLFWLNASAHVNTWNSQKNLNQHGENVSTFTWHLILIILIQVIKHIFVKHFKVI